MSLKQINRSFQKFFKLFFPSWAFFDEKGLCLRIEFKKSNEERYIQPSLNIPRSLQQIFFNPLHNKNLALFSAMERLIFNLENTEYDFSKDQDFKTLKRWGAIETQSSLENSTFRILLQLGNTWEVIFDSEKIEST